MTRNDIVKNAEKYKGKYTKHRNKFTKHFAGRFSIDKSGYYKMGYCTIFALYNLDELGLLGQIPTKELGKNTSNTQYLYKYFKKKGLVVGVKDAKEGALAFKKVGGVNKKSSGHTAIFKKYEHGKVYTVDGNVKGGVCTRAKNPKLYLGFVNINLPFTTGKTYVLEKNLFIRTGAGKNCGKVKVDKMTPNAKANLTKDGKLKKGTKVTCKGSKFDSSGCVWLKTPSGWICGIDKGVKNVGECND